MTGAGDRQGRRTGADIIIRDRQCPLDSQWQPFGQLQLDTLTVGLTQRYQLDRRGDLVFQPAPGIPEQTVLDRDLPVDRRKRKGRGLAVTQGFPPVGHPRNIEVGQQGDQGTSAIALLGTQFAGLATGI